MAEGDALLYPSELTNDNEVHPDLDVAEPVDTLADEHPGVPFHRFLDPQLAALGPDPDEGIVDSLPALPPLYDRRGVAGDGTDQLHVLALSHDALHLLLLGHRGSCRQNTVNHWNELYIENKCS